MNEDFTTHPGTAQQTVFGVLHSLESVPQATAVLLAYSAQAEGTSSQISGSGVLVSDALFHVAVRIVYKISPVIWPLWRSRVFTPCCKTAHS